MLDRDGYRPNVGIILVNSRNEVFWGKRIREHSWQFPQGGIKRGESPEQAMYRELHEEVGLRPEHVRIIARTRDWLRYDVPTNWVRRDWRGHYRGQKQIWFLLRMVGRDCDVQLRATEHPEFDAWRWNEYWIPLNSVIEFKREVYRMALDELSRHLFRAQEAPRFLRHRGRPRRTREAGASAEADSEPASPARAGPATGSISSTPALPATDPAAARSTGAAAAGGRRPAEAQIDTLADPPDKAPIKA